MSVELQRCREDYRALEVVALVRTDENARLRERIAAWREVGEEMQRIVSFMTLEQRDDLLPDWFTARLDALLADKIAP